MDASDPIYQICVDMAEQLVPDVCALIMEFLTDIHIELGRQRWLERITKVNVEFKNNTHHPFIVERGQYFYYNNGRYFLFNWRQLYPNLNTLIYNIRRGQDSFNSVAKLPLNY